MLTECILWQVFCSSNNSCIYRSSIAVHLRTCTENVIRRAHFVCLHLHFRWKGIENLRQELLSLRFFTSDFLFQKETKICYDLYCLISVWVFCMLQFRISCSSFWFSLSNFLFPIFLAVFKVFNCSNIAFGADLKRERITQPFAFLLHCV